MDWYDKWQKSRGESWKPTELSPEDVAAFKKDMVSHPWFKNLKEELLADLLRKDSDYDYAGAWKAGLMPQPYAPDGGAYHWVSSTQDGKMLKSPNHPTAWMEYFMRETGEDPAEIGLHSPEIARIYSDLLSVERGN